MKTQGDKNRKERGNRAMKYLIIGAGGTGGCIGAYMTEAGKDVTLIARGAHLAAMQADGLRMETTKKGNYTVKPVKAADMEHYGERPDVVFVCVKGYSLKETVPFIRRAAGPETVVIPILNIYGTGGRLQEQLPELLVTDGCIYIAAEIKEPGCLWQNGDIFRVVFGVRKPSEYRAVLAEVKKDLDDSGITGVLSDNIQRDALQKFSYVSPAATCGQYYDAMGGEMQKPGKVRDIVQTNLDILDSLTPEASTSMQRDVKKGKASEMDGLVFEVVRMGRKYGVKLPVYEKIAGELRQRGFS